jgi:hypothetical protein
MGLFDGKKRAKRKQARRDARQERQSSRQQARTDRTALRGETKQAAYAAGINPNQFISDGLQAGAQVVGDVFDFKTASISQTPSPGGGAGGDKSKTNTPPSGGNDMMIPLVAGGALLLLTMKK